MDSSQQSRQEVLCLIIARGGSKGLPKKNILDLHGIPLIAWPIIYARKSHLITDLVVSTDSEEIAEVATRFGAMVPYLRPTELASDEATTESVLQHGINFMEKKLNKHYDYCVFLTATDIFRPEGLIEKGIEFLNNNQKVESFFVGQKTTKNFWEKNDQGEWVRVKNWMANYSSRQNRKFLVREDTGLFCVSRARLWRIGRRIGDNVQIHIIDDSFSNIDIHTIDDLELARFALKYRLDIINKRQ